MPTIHLTLVHYLQYRIESISQETLLVAVQKKQLLLFL